MARSNCATERFNYFQSAIDCSVSACKRIRNVHVYLPSFLIASLLLWIITSAQFEFRFTFRAFTTDSWEHLMNIFIVVRPSLCTEGSLESTLHDASRVVAALLRSFRRAISKADDRSHTTSPQFDAATASAGDSIPRFIAITAPRSCSENLEKPKSLERCFDAPRREIKIEFSNAIEISILSLFAYLLLYLCKFSLRWHQYLSPIAF